MNKRLLLFSNLRALVDRPDATSQNYRIIFRKGTNRMLQQIEASRAGVELCDEIDHLGSVAGVLYLTSQPLFTSHSQKPVIPANCPAI